MKTYALASLFVCIVFVGLSQGKSYKNQINRTLTEKNNLQRTVEKKENIPSTQTPKYQKKNIQYRVGRYSEKGKSAPFL